MAFIDSLKVIRGAQNKVSMSFWMMKPPENVWKEFQIVGTIGVAKTARIVIDFKRPADIPEETWDDLIRHIQHRIEVGVIMKPGDAMKTK